MHAFSIVLSSAYLPPISYFQAIAKASKVYVDIHEHYQKQSFRNRALIINSHGILPLSIPVIQCEGNHTKMQCTGISNQTPWQRSHWRSMEAAYNNSPFFLYYKDDLEKFYTNSYFNLVEFNMMILSFFMKKLHLNTPVETSTVFIPYGSASFQGDELLDLRQMIHPKRESIYSLSPYIRSFDVDIPSTKAGNISMLDLLCNSGSEAVSFL